MTTIGDIQNGEHCEGCKPDCILFVPEADCCIYDLSISRLAVEVGRSDPNQKVEYVQDTRVQVVINTEDSIDGKKIKN